MYRITIYKEVLSGNLAGLTVVDSHTVTPEFLEREFNAATARIGGKVHKMTLTGAKYKVVRVEYEEVVKRESSALIVHLRFATVKHLS